MQIKPFRFYALVLLVISLGIFTGCDKNENTTDLPAISFITDSGFIYSSDTLKLGETFKVEIHAEGISANITNFIIRVKTSSDDVFLDSGMNCSTLDFEKVFTKGISANEEWTFIVRDKYGNSSQKAITIVLDTSGQFGHVKHYNSVILGAQNQNTTGNFFSFTTDSVYTLPQAYNNQSIIDLCYYYDFIDGDANTIASPGANIDASVFTGPNALANWTVKPTTRFKTTTLTQVDFNNVLNDSLLIASYGLSAGTRKAKNLTSGNIFSFQNQNGKYGLFLVKNVTGTDAGTIEIEIKVQQ